MAYRRHYNFRQKRSVRPPEFQNRRSSFFYDYGLLEQMLLAEMLRQANQNYRQSQQLVRPTPQPAFDPYAVLGIPKTASKEEISAAYRKKAQENHPDKVAHLGPGIVDLAEQRMKEINEAYNRLKS